MKKLLVTGIGLMLAISGFTQKFELGEINGASYLICIPDNWNQGLVMYAHGYVEIGEEIEAYEAELNEFIELFTSRGFAFAESSYKRQGLVIKDGMEDTEALRSYFEIKYGKPDICLVTGHSMGGMISLATIEKYEVEYDGAMPMCGWLGPVHSLMKQVLDLLVTYDYLFGENNGEIVTGEKHTESETISKQLEQKPELSTLFSEHYRIRVPDLPEVIVFGQNMLKESATWLGGLPVGNTETIYDGFGNKNNELNKEVRRYAADPEAAAYYIQYYTPTGKISDPVLALHTTYDELVPVDNYKYYEAATQIQGTSHLYAQQYVVRDGHCNFKLEETGQALDQLLMWIREGTRPSPVYY